MMDNGVEGLVGAQPGDIVIVHWGDANHGNETWYSWPEVQAYHEQGSVLVEHVGFFFALSDTVLTLVGTHGADGTSAPWNVPRAWVHGSKNIHLQTPEDVPWPSTSTPS